MSNKLRKYKNWNAAKESYTKIKYVADVNLVKYCYIYKKWLLEILFLIFEAPLIPKSY